MFSFEVNVAEIDNFASVSVEFELFDLIVVLHGFFNRTELDVVDIDYFHHIFPNK